MSNTSRYEALMYDRERMIWRLVGVGLVAVGVVVAFGVTLALYLVG